MVVSIDRRILIRMEAKRNGNNLYIIFSNFIPFPIIFGLF